ncbi:DUF3261 domain-containing protein [Pantoea anthophila]|uniref:DUF3261 domain-containing protein n=1 Tax=Pantoea anthophila TaxID=470931 RepID=UPI002DB5E27B|nr:DUF3261 domain-containing protein [Pantoea anthophila]MEB5705227.1 DUF3261 domain-containing protein [Pantoea anthophila]MEB6515770.1 DUF3261 domain-containing protein [Pantoea anthophila]
MIRAASLLLTALLLSACAGPAPDSSRPSAWLKPGVKVTLPPPGIHPAFQQQQLLTGQVKGQSQSLLVLLSADEQQIDLAGLSSVGIRLFSLRYDAGGIHTQQLMPLPQMPAASQVLADIMLSYWPRDVWLKQLPSGWRLEDQGLKRRLFDADNQLVTEIDYLQRGSLRQPISIRQHAFGYQIRIQHLDAS